MADKIDLGGLNLNHFTEFDAEMYCQLSGINSDDITTLWLNNNNLTDISGISIFKNVKELFLSNNNIMNLIHLKDLRKLVYLYVSNLNLTDEIETVNILKNFLNLKELYCFNTFKTVKIRNELPKKIWIYD